MSSICIRNATVEDLQWMQNANLSNLPENYTLKYYLYHLLTWPEASFVAEVNGKIVGYVVGKLNDEDDATAEEKRVGHVTSLSVMRSYRRMGIAGKLMDQCLLSLKGNFNSSRVSLHVRESNRAALHLYKERLQFTVLSVESKYYADGEDAYYMEKVL